MSYRYKVFNDPHAFVDRARNFLLADRGLNNTLLGVLQQFLTGEHDEKAPVLFGAVESGHDVVGCTWCSVPSTVGLSRIPDDATSTVVDGVGAVHNWLDGAVGHSNSVRRFGDAWAVGHNAEVRDGMLRGVYGIEQVRRPSATTAGKMVLAHRRDIPMLIDWGHGFLRDSGVVSIDPDDRAGRFVESRRMFLWWDNEPRAMAATIPTMENGVRIGYVYTPPEHRGKGYAGTLVAALTEAMLAVGRTSCFLHADLSNPTSTGIYTRLGYVKVGEILDITFVRSADGRQARRNLPGREDGT